MPSSRRARLGDYAALQMLIAAPNYGANSDFTSGRIGRSATCTSGLNPFLIMTISEDCLKILETSLKVNTTVEQTQAELNFQGGLFDLPAGEVRAAIGADYRKESAEYLVDRGVSAQNIVSSAIGMFGTSSTAGSTTAKEVYVEALVPVLKDVPLVRALSINAGFRHSEYDTAGGADTWKLTADWDVIDYIKIRGGYQVANRAPNVAELYQSPQNVQANWGDHDPCSILTVAPYGNRASNPNRAQVQALCSALSGGFPIDSNYIGNQPVYFPAGVDLTRGNPDLKSEEAKTWTIGTVLRSPFEVEALRNLTLSVDLYSIKIDGAIGVASTQPVYQSCLNGLGTNPTYDPNNEFCRKIIRLPSNGYWVAVDAAYSNLAFIKTAGMDVQLDWRANTPFFGGRTGTVFANVNYNHLDKYDVQAFTGASLVHYKDAISTGYGNNFPFGAQFKWKLFTTLGYSVGPVSASMNWRHLPSIRNLAVATNPTARQLPTESYDIFDIAAQWEINSTFVVRGGLDNLFDTDPNKVGVNPGVTNAAAMTDRGVYDVLGRRFFVGVTARF
jgi:outer membrane receptor protein involved in Fe transport